MLSNQKEDLDKSIIYLTESILLPSQSWQVHGTKILHTLSFLALALVKRSRMNKLPEDAIHAATYLRILRDQPHQTFGIPRHKVTGLLIDSLAFQVELESGNVMVNLAEMADLCHELLILDTPNDHTTMSFSLFLVALLSNLKVIPPEVWDPDQPVDQFIECLRAAREHQLMRDEVRLALACCLYVRYSRTCTNDDYEEAASMLDEVIASNSPEDSFLAPAQQLVTMLATMRSSSHRTPEYSEEATYRVKELLGSSFAKESLDPGFVFDLDGAASQRSLHFGSESEMEPVKESLGKLSFSQLTLRMIGVSYTKDDDSEVGRLYKIGDLLMRLLFEVINNDGAKIDEAIGKGRAILASSSPKDSLTSFPSLMFGEMLFQAFMHTNKVEYLNEFINARRPVLDPNLPLRPIWRFRILHQLSLTLVIRSKMLSKLLPDRSMQDMDEALELLSQCVENKHGGLPDRCWFACRWAYIARDNRHPTVSTAYESAMSLMPDTLLFAPTLQLQHHTLATSDDFHKMSLDYASYRVELGQLKEAIETLERGRALLWSEMRHLRASIDQLPQGDLQLGQKFAAVNRDLEELTKSIPPSLDLLTDDDGAADDLRAVGPFGHLLVKQRKLLEERNKLISQIRALPGFENYLTSPSFDTVRSAASSGPVIIINHSIWRSDILIILRDNPPSLIPTSDDLFVRANALKTELLDARNEHKLDSEHYNQTLAHVLTELYDLVGKPVIHRLRQLNVPEQSRVWWCPTSVFCSLPLHAMGPIPSDDGVEDRYFLDIYISSYTPTLSALIEPDHREPGSPTSELPSLLLVAHFDVPSPDVSLSEVCKDVKVVQALEKRLSVKSLISEDAKPTSVLDGLRDHQFVHFVCHGTLEAGKPFDAGFELHGNERLTLLDVVRSRLPAAEFAFLSACHTAELTEGSSADEGLHLAAAVQYCGFRSVVGTMWAMANDDGQDVAKYFYQSMFPKKEKGEPVPYYKRSAGALRDAVKKLREKKRGVTLERWVNFVHYGA
jgi:CHAT domain-containing protein